MLRQGSGVWFRLRVFSSVRTACVIFAYLLAVLVQLRSPFSNTMSTFDVFDKAYCLGLHMFYSIAGSIVRWVRKGYTILENWSAETGICKQLASLGRFMQRVLYTAENFRCALYFGHYMFVKLQAWLLFHAEVRGHDKNSLFLHPQN